MSENQCSEHISYYYWIISDWAYLGADRLNDMSLRLNVRVEHYPIRLLDVYAKTGGIPLSERSVERQNYRFEEMKRWRDALSLPLVLEPSHFPINDQLASCLIYACKAAGEDAGKLSSLILGALWADDLDIGNADVLRKICAKAGMDGEQLLEAAQKEETVAELKNGTQQAVRDGVFGSPFYIYKGQRFWGQDRLDFLEALVAKGR